MLEIEVRRDDGPEVSAPVVEIGDIERALPSDVADNSNSRAGISDENHFNKNRNNDPHTDLLPLFHLSQHCIEHKVF